MKLVQIAVGITLVLCGFGIMGFAATLATQLLDWIMIVFTVGIFAVGAMAFFGGVDVLRGGSIKDIFREIFETIARLK
jgi:TM2 domain-containing membrane protein YozV